MEIKYLDILYLIIIVNKYWVIADDVTKIPESTSNSVSEESKSTTQNFESVDVKISGEYYSSRTLYAKYVASLRHTWWDLEKFGSGHFCCGTIIGRNIILTAASCVYLFTVHYPQKPPINVVVGTQYRYFLEDTGQVFPVAKIYIHSDYPRETAYDIAMIILNGIIKIDGVTTAIAKLPTQKIVPLTKCTAVSWGKSSKTSLNPNKLRYVDMYVISESRCLWFYSTKSKAEFCATNSLNHSYHECWGDIGAPLLIDDTLVGITIQGHMCVIKNASGIYTDVYEYSDWINRNKNQAAIIRCNLFDLWLFYIVYSLWNISIFGTFR